MALRGWSLQESSNIVEQIQGQKGVLYDIVNYIENNFSQMDPRVQNYLDPIANISSIRSEIESILGIFDNYSRRLSELNQTKQAQEDAEMAWLDSFSGSNASTTGGGSNTTWGGNSGNGGSGINGGGSNTTWGGNGGTGGSGTTGGGGNTTWGGGDNGNTGGNSNTGGTGNNNWGNGNGTNSTGGNNNNGGNGNGTNGTGGNNNNWGNGNGTNGTGGNNNNWGNGNGTNGTGGYNNNWGNGNGTTGGGGNTTWGGVNGTGGSTTTWGGGSGTGGITTNWGDGITSGSGGTGNGSGSGYYNWSNGGDTGGSGNSWGNGGNNNNWSTTGGGTYGSSTLGGGSDNSNWGSSGGGNYGNSTLSGGSSSIGSGGNTGNGSGSWGSTGITSFGSEELKNRITNPLNNNGSGSWNSNNDSWKTDGSQWGGSNYGTRSGGAALGVGGTTAMSAKDGILTDGSTSASAQGSKLNGGSSQSGGSGILDILGKGTSKLATSVSPGSENETSSGSKAGLLAGAGLAMGGAVAAAAGYVIANKKHFYTFTPDDWEDLDKITQQSILEDFIVAGFNDAEIETFKNSTFKILASELDEHIKKVKEAYDNNENLEVELKEMYNFSVFDDSDKVVKYLVFVMMLIDGKNSIDTFNLYNILNPSLSDSEDADFIYAGINMEEYIFDENQEEGFDEDEDYSNDSTKSGRSIDATNKEWLNGIGLEN